MSMADQGVLMNGGRIEQNDSPDQLYGKPATEFSARFIGTPPMNVLRLDDETRVLVTGTAQLGAHVPGDAAALGIRPEHLQLSADDGIPASVASVEYSGATRSEERRGGKEGVST